MAGQMSRNALKHRVKAFGPRAEELAAVGRSVLASDGVRQTLGESSHRLLSVQMLDAPESAKKRARPSKPDRFRATNYDYSRNRALLVDGSLRHPSRQTITESAVQPPASNEEWEEAVATLPQYDVFAAALREGTKRVFNPMPPVISEEQPDGISRRMIAVGLLDHRERRAEIASVDLMRGSVERFKERAPLGSRARNDTLCGAPLDAAQPTIDCGTAGPAWITISQGGKVFWRFLAVRPAASSSTNGSGIELPYVDYLGKRVHVPNLNVKYDGDACRPHRVWQWQEGQIQVTGIDPVPGFRLCNSPAATILDTGSDTGNFLGIVTYVQGQQAVLVSEMQAGWYRYLSEWRFDTNGTIRPRFGFAAVDNHCVCNRHHHHRFWRLAFDIETAGHNQVLEFHDQTLFGSYKWHEKFFEIRRPRDPCRKPRWRVANTPTRRGYEILPREEDSISSQMPDTLYGRGDVRILRYHRGEIDDGSVAVGPPYEADIDRWLNGESVANTDVVIW